MTLTDFLLARLAEDESAADLVLRPYGDHASTNEAEWWPVEREWFKIGLSSDETPLLTRMTPQRVRAEVAAKRRLIDWSAPVSGTERVPTDRPGVYDRREVRYVNEDGEDVLRYLAMPYAEHPDYDDDWRP